MNTQLAELCEQLRLNAERAQKLVSKAGEARMAVRPQPDSWSAAECLVHLTLSTEMFLPVWRTAFASARAGGLLASSDEQKRPFKMDFAGRLLTWVLEPPARFRVKAPPFLRPAITGGELAGFLASQDQLLELVSDSNGLALDRIKVATPVASRVHYNVWASFRATDAHQRRHLWQAEQSVGL